MVQIFLTAAICRRRVGVPQRQGRAKIIPDGGATGVGLLAVTSDQQILCCRVAGGCRGPVLAPRERACSVNLALSAQAVPREAL